jgi:hypothetical protein
MKVCVSAAPLVGLLGTVTGMLSTFGALSSGSGGEKTMSMVAGGISEALITTETGLVIALPGLFLQYQLSRKHERYVAFLAHLQTVYTQAIHLRTGSERRTHARRAALTRIARSLAARAASPEPRPVQEVVAVGGAFPAGMWPRAMARLLPPNRAPAFGQFIGIVGLCERFSSSFSAAAHGRALAEVAQRFGLASRSRIRAFDGTPRRAAWASVSPALRPARTSKRDCRARSCRVAARRLAPTQRAQALR